MQTPNSQAFYARLAHWTARGYSGEALFARLAEDPEAPPTYDTVDLAAIQGVRPLSVKQQRARGTGPDFLRISHRAVRYTRPDLCRWLAGRLVRRAA